MSKGPSLPFFKGFESKSSFLILSAEHGVCLFESLAWDYITLIEKKKNRNKKTIISRSFKNIIYLHF
ncbi:hypothetical protein BpHYR1_006226 [Brachionus plicatilis]|uniref:Uncharacterized protein n=1 Tax=Brachionus plicatilis TaxID=10195 RepID=A0A3M7S8B1_BRAPC|nr:hypothetical protein BpHYR1_006226 [Brachionus plicatilis]